MPTDITLDEATALCHGYAGTWTPGRFAITKSFGISDVIVSCPIGCEESHRHRPISMPPADAALMVAVIEKLNSRRFNVVFLASGECDIWIPGEKEHWIAYDPNPIHAVILAAGEMLKETQTNAKG